MSLRWFLPIALAIIALSFWVAPPQGMMSGFAITMAIGGVLMLLGNTIPGLNRIGGGVILAILMPAVLFKYGLIPEHVATVVGDFYRLSSFGEFIVAALIVGSILGMDRSLLMAAGSRIILPIIGTIVLCFAIFGVIGQLTGYGVGRMMFYVVGPVLGGGIAAGAMPISELIAANTDQTAEAALTQLVPAVVVANLVCIGAAGTLAWVGRKRPNLFRNFNGEGNLTNVKAGFAKIPVGQKVDPSDAVRSTVIGLFLAGFLLMLANTLSSLMPAVHGYVFLILICALWKIFLPMPEFLVQSVDMWFRLVASAFIPAVIVAVSFVAIDIDQILTLINDPIYMISTIAVVIVALLAAGFIGWLVRLNFIESSISAGLGLADIGSSGDLAVLSAANRIELLPFLSISSRIGGGLVVLTLSALAPFFL
ncbi:2-hydroxycarboxylate transporter family protein [Salinicola salarius]|nr:2-hydroxycarboxylate transporter family protein [Salinicola salarius]